MVKVGCCGFPVSHENYFQRFATVELNSTFYNLPRLETVQRWRQEAPKDFVFSLKVWQLITHLCESPTYGKLNLKLDRRALSACGHFKPTEEVDQAWSKVEEIARILKAHFILFQTPPSFYPHADHIRNMYRFFKRIRRDGSLLVWEPRGSWEYDVVRKICEDLGLLQGMDPTMRPVQGRGIRYFRMHGRLEGRRIRYAHDYSDGELKTLLERCMSHPSYVYFNNVSMWRDAQRFERMLSCGVPSRRILRPKTCVE